MGFRDREGRKRVLTDLGFECARLSLWSQGTVLRNEGGRVTGSGLLSSMQHREDEPVTYILYFDFFFYFRYIKCKFSFQVSNNFFQPPPSSSSPFLQAPPSVIHKSVLPASEGSSQYTSLLTL
jgi:hypothetical protein